jgi:hypothetical protein
LASGAIALLVGIEGAWRAWRASPSGTVSGRVNGLLLLALGLTSAGGLGLLVGGAAVHEQLHFLYALLALGIVPVASSLTRRASPRRQGIATVLGAIVALVVIARLFQTG